MPMNVSDQTAAGRHWLPRLAGWLASCLLLILLYAAAVRPDLRLWDGIWTHGPVDRQAVALTFDDGPHPLWAPLLADSLERHGAKGTFYLVGFEAQRYPEITARLVRAGHQIGNHSLSHPYPNLTVLPPARVAYEIRTANKILIQFTRQPIRTFRPPGGGLDDDIITVLKADHLRLAWWSENVGDWSSPTPAMTEERFRTTLRPGLVALMHERANTISALEQILAELAYSGYNFVTFDSLMRQ